MPSKCVCCGACCCGWMADGIQLCADDVVPDGLEVVINGIRCMRMVTAWDGQGRAYNKCAALGADGKCTIHASKPTVCKIAACTKAGGRVQARYRFAIGKVPE